MNQSVCKLNQQTVYSKIVVFYLGLALSYKIKR